MLIYDTTSHIHFDYQVPQVTMVACDMCYIPLVEYVNPLTGESKFYLYASNHIDLVSFETDLLTTHGKEYICPNGAGRIIVHTWQHLNVNNLLNTLENDILAKSIGALLDTTTSTLVVGLNQDLDMYIPSPNLLRISMVYSKDYKFVRADTKTRVAYSTDTGVDFRYALTCERLVNTPQLYMLGIVITLVDNTLLEYITPVMNAKNKTELLTSIYKTYKLDSKTVMNANCVPLSISYFSEELDDIRNYSRFDKCNILLDRTTNTLQIRTLLEMNPLIAQARGIPQFQPGQSRLMPVMCV